MGFLDKAMAAAEQAATKAKEGVEDVQVKRELSQANAELGRVAYELAERGEISHARLTPIVERIRALNARVAEGEEPAATTAAGSSEAGSRAARRALAEPDLRECCRASVRQPGLGQLLQGPPALRPPGARVRAAHGRRRRPLGPAGLARRAEPGAPRADARPRRRAAARRVRRHPLVLRRGHPVRSERAPRAGADAPVDVLRAVRPRACDRRRPLLARLLRAAGGVRRPARGADRRRLPRARRPGARPRRAASSSSGTPRRSRTSRSMRTRTSPTRAASTLAAYPAIRAWLERVEALPGHVPIDA